ncbi:hypothetical protein M8312_13330 [Sphingomonas sp. KRR8]|uniref:hypothetical protein n=1 Tax=Sphingomonas sp. KRR8 TaxID=2942996 RepID=UPI002020F6B5|nr:hypothetical protein [Sphingomonas sp. KRR8]URD60740.1 hypothetical protein M8312_13330 [Sphingomonas sp. KRR8]
MTDPVMPTITRRDYDELLAKLEGLRSALVVAARDELAAGPSSGAELLNSYVDSAQSLIEGTIADRQPPDGGFANLIGLGPTVARDAGDAPAPTSVPSYDNDIRRERLLAVADLYYLYQHERAGVFRAVLKLQTLFRSGEVRLSDGPGAMALYQYDRKKVLRFTAGERHAAYRKVFGYTSVPTPAGAEPNSAFHGLLSNFCEHVSRYFSDKRVSEVLRPDGTRETFGSMAVVRRSGLDLRHNLKQVSYGNIAVLRSEVLILLREAFAVLGSADVRSLFGADSAWDVLEEVMKRYFVEVPLTSQRSRMATSGRAILNWLAEDYLLSQVRIDFEAFLEAIIDPCDDWRTSAESIGLSQDGASGGSNVVPFRAPLARTS